jgi:tetratricopeptide (TPR) repeat protein
MESVIQHIQAPQKITGEDVAKIDSLLHEFPYFQTAQLLLAKGLLNTDSIRYNRQLKKAAIYSLDRKQLFKLITQHNPEEKSITVESTTKQSTEQALAIGQPLAFEKEEEYSFSEWLALTKVKKIDRTPKPSTKQLIESLIENNDLVTPTLAKVYLEQGHYDKAISAYEKLSLKYPEKNSLFADQIKLINKLKEK